MIKTLCRSVTLSVFAGLMSVGTVAAQDFQRTYSVGAGSTVNIQNISGNVTVTGYDGDAITVSGFKEGRDRDLVEVDDRSSQNAVDVRVRYPERCNCDASIRFQVRVPRSVAYRFDAVSSVSGDVEVRTVKGDLRAKSVSGQVTVEDANGSTNASSVSGDVRVGDNAGSVNAQSVSGNVEVAVVRLEGTDDMKFSSTSGDVRVRLPRTLDAEVEMSTLSGELETDFPLEIIKPRHGPGQKARGRVGSGSRNLRISTISGSISLKNS